MRGRSVRIFVAVLVVASATVGAALLGRGSSPPAAAVARGAAKSALEVIDSTDQLGAHWPAEVVFHTLSVKNVSDFPITILRVVASCDCTKADAREVTIQPNEVGHISLEVNFPRVVDWSGPLEREFEVSTSPILSNGDSQKFVLKGILQTPVSVSKAAVTAVGNIDAPEQLKLDPLRYRWHERVEEVSISGAGDFVVQSEVGDEPRQGSILVQSRNRYGVGSLSGGVLISARVLGVDAKLDCRIPIEQTIQCDIDVLGSPVVSSNGEPESAKHLQLISKTRTPFEIVSLDPSDAAITVERSDDADVLIVRVLSFPLAESQVLRSIMLTVRTSIYPEPISISVPVFIYSVATGISE